MKMFRLRNGTGDSVSRCALRLSHGTAKTGCGRGAIFVVQSGGETPRWCAANSTIPATQFATYWSPIRGLPELIRRGIRKQVVQFCENMRRLAFREPRRKIPEYTGSGHEVTLAPDSLQTPDRRGDLFTRMLNSLKVRWPQPSPTNRHTPGRSSSILVR